MVYFVPLLQKAAMDTWELVAAMPIRSGAVAVAAPFIGIWLHRLKKEHGKMKEKIEDIKHGAQALLILVAGVYLFCFLYLSPRNLYEEEGRELKKAQDAIRARDASAPSSVGAWTSLTESQIAQWAAALSSFERGEKIGIKVFSMESFVPDGAIEVYARKDDPVGPLVVKLLQEASLPSKLDVDASEGMPEHIRCEIYIPER